MMNNEPDSILDEFHRRLREEEWSAQVYMQNTFRRRQITTRLVGIGLGLVSLIVTLTFLIDVPSNVRLFVYGISSVIAVSLAFLYLQSNRTEYIRQREFADIDGESMKELSRQNFQLKRELETLEMRLSDVARDVKEGKYRAAEFSEEDKARVFASIQSKLESGALESYIRGLKELVAVQYREQTLEDRYLPMARRLAQEIQDLGRRGNLNLILGISTTLSGLAILGYSVFNPPAQAQQMELLMYFIPRVSLVLLIELFAFFFLKLYKQSLEGIKYFQNELTNVESKYLALQVTIRSGDEKLRSDVVGALAKTERNFVLAKDQKTVELEKERINRESNRSIMDALQQLLKRKNGS